MAELALRVAQLKRWAAHQLGGSLESWAVVSGDASFRRYFRCYASGKRYILVDAPPQKESIRDFIQVQRLFNEQGLPVPQVLAVDEGAGFMMLSDFGDKLLLSHLQTLRVASSEEMSFPTKKPYQAALLALLQMQQIPIAKLNRLPVYDTALLIKEMRLFDEWYVNAYLGLSLSSVETKMLDSLYQGLAGRVVKQPQVCVHRDYHARNIMCLPECKGDEGKIGLIDFQDAVLGPITYDLVSLLKDAYIHWPSAQVNQWVSDYYELLQAQHPLQAKGVLASRDVFQVWFDEMGLQRHLKVMGIFARLALRDNKPGYLADIPGVLEYALAVTAHYPVFSALDVLLRERVLPAVAARNTDG